jgi:hypothetical protein
VGRYSKQIGFKSSRTAFHSFRHNFADALRAADLPEYINKALVGHSDRSVHGQYGGGAVLSQLKTAIDKVSYAGADLSFLTYRRTRRIGRRKPRQTNTRWARLALLHLALRDQFSFFDTTANYFHDAALSNGEVDRLIWETGDPQQRNCVSHHFALMTNFRS